MSKHFEDFRAQLTAREAEIAKLLPPVVTLDMFMTCCIMAVKQVPDLLYCDRRSLHTALTKAAMDGLIPDGRRAVVVPFKDKDGNPNAGYIPMYQGILQRALELGDVGPINADIVRANDVFEHSLGDDPRVTHRRPKLGQPRGDIVGAYAIFWVKGRIWHREVFDVPDIEKARSVSRAANSPAWTKWYEEMARIRPIRRGSKYVPMCDALRTIIEREDDLVDLDRTPDVSAPLAIAPPSEMPIAAVTSIETGPVASRGPVDRAVGTGQPKREQKRRALDVGFADLGGRAA